MKNIKGKKILEYLLPTIFIAITTFITLWIKGIFPFGTNNIGYIDYNDGLVPAYTWLWDILHGNANLFASWNLGAGGSMITSAVLNGFISPISWLVALFPRADIAYGITFLVFIKMSLIATFSYICFKKLFPKVSIYISMLYALLFTFSGWFFVHFTNIGWLDLIMLLPLLLLSIKQILTKHKIFWFVIILSFMLMASYYISYMILVGLVICAIIYIIILSKDKKRESALLFYGVIISMLISAVAFFPSLLTSLKAHRFSSGVSQAGLFDSFLSKFTILLFYPILFVFFVKLLMTYKKDKKNVLTFILCFAICLIGLFIEPINAMWHTGSYYSFPYRYSFILIFILILSNLYYIQKYLSKDKYQLIGGENTTIIKQKKTELYYILVIVFTIAFLVLGTINVSFLTSAHPYKDVGWLGIMWYALSFASGFILIWYLLKTKYFNIAKVGGGVFIILLCLTQVFGYQVKFFGAGVRNSNASVSNAYYIETSVLDTGYKIKDKDNLYNLNFPLLISYPSLSTWIHISDERQFVGYDLLGQNTASTILKSSGGTLISDFLLGNKYIISKYPLDSLLYTPLYEFKYDDTIVYLYEYSFELPKVTLLNEDLNELVGEETNDIDIQNILYKAIFDSNMNILIRENSIETSVDDNTYTYTLNVNGKKNMYVQGKNVEYLKLDNKEYKIADGFLDIGLFDNESMTVEVKYKEGEEQYINFSSLNVATFLNSVNDYEYNNGTITFKNSSIEVSVDNTNNYKYCFIPFTNLNNMQGTLNSETSEISLVLSTFMQVELLNGENTLVLTYKPQYIVPCLIITLISLIIFIGFSIWNKYKNITTNKFLIWFGFIGALIIAGVVVLLVYVKPTFSYFGDLVSLIKG